MRIIAIVLLPSVLFLSSCVYSDLKRLPVHSLATAKPSSARPKLILDELIDWSTMPDMVPIAITTMTHDHLSNREKIARRIWWVAQKEGADVVRVMEMVPGEKNLQRTSGIMYKLAPVRLGFGADKDGVVIHTDESTRAIGLLEGDRVVSVAGVPYSNSADGRGSQFFQKLWELHPGDLAEIIWIRPGAGKMQGSLSCGPNDRSMETIADSVLWVEPPTPEPR